MTRPITHLLFPSLLSAALLELAMVAVASPGPLTFYVATNGNDAWSGHLALPNQARSDGPMASLAEARDRILGRRAEARYQPVQVLVRGGTYYLSTPFVLEPQDSGTAEAPVVYGAFKSEKPVFTGGRLIKGSHQTGSLWETTIPEVKAGGWYFSQLFVN